MGDKQGEVELVSKPVNNTDERSNSDNRIIKNEVETFNYKGIKYSVYTSANSFEWEKFSGKYLEIKYRDLKIRDPKDRKDIQSVVSCIYTIIKMKNICYPFKRLDWKGSIMEMYTNLQNFMQFEAKKRWKHDEYTIQFEALEKVSIIRPPATIDLRFTHPKFNDEAENETKLELTTAKYYLFNNNYFVDYKKYDMIVEYFSEASRLRSFVNHSTPPPKQSRNNNNHHQHNQHNNNKQGRGKSPLELWDEVESEYLKGALRKLIDERKDIDRESLREALYESKLVTECGHEKVTFLTEVYRLFQRNEKHRLRIFDACAGWGDRLIAAIAVNAECYLGVDPNTDTTPAFKSIIHTFIPHLKSSSHNNNNNNNNNDDNNKTEEEGDAEKFQVLTDAMPHAKLPSFIPTEGGYFDVCWISPPSYDSEVYGEHEGQSIVQYPDRQVWAVEFLFATMDRMWHLLSRFGYFVIQSLLSVEMNCYLRYRYPNAVYLGVVSLKGGRNRPLWIWMKGDDEYNSYTLPNALPFYSRDNATSALSSVIRKRKREDDDNDEHHLSGDNGGKKFKEDEEGGIQRDE